MQQLQKGDSKLLNAWAFYDWANSVYALVISTTIFPLYYEALFRQKNIEEIVLFGFSIRSEALISYVTALGFLIIAFISPLLSGIADYLGNKKFFLKFFCYVGAAAAFLPAPATNTFPVGLFSLSRLAFMSDCNCARRSKACLSFWRDSAIACSAAFREAF